MALQTPWPELCKAFSRSGCGRRPEDYGMTTFIGSSSHLRGRGDGLLFMGVVLHILAMAVICIVSRQRAYMLGRSLSANKTLEFFNMIRIDDSDIYSSNAFHREHYRPQCLRS